MEKPTTERATMQRDMWISSQAKNPHSAPGLPAGGSLRVPDRLETLDRSWPHLRLHLGLQAINFGF